MGVRIIEQDNLACLYDSVTDIAFGPVFYDLDESEAGEDVSAADVAEGFLKYLKQDARTFTSGEIMYQHACYRNEIELSGWTEVAQEVEA